MGSPLLVPGLVLVLVLVIYRYIVYPVLLSPLSKVPPAHWSSSFTPAWILYYRLKRKENPAVHAAHERLGPLVRLGPNEVSVNCVDGGLRTIYAGGFEKHEFYSVFANYGVDCAFSTVRHGPHSARKRMVSNIYAKSTLQSSPHMKGISEALMCHRLLPRLTANGDRTIDMYEVFAGAAMDFVTAYIFGLSQSSNYLEDPDHCKRFVTDYKGRHKYLFWVQETPRLFAWAKKFGAQHWLVPKWVDKANDDIEAWIMGMCDASEKLHGQPGTAPKDEPAVYNQLRAMMKKANGNKDGAVTARERLDLASEVLDHALAGFDTTSITLTFLAWELSRPENKHIQQALQRELNGMSPMYRCGSDKEKTMETPNLKELDALPMLHAIVMESLRLHAAIPGVQPRVTPENAELGPTGCSVKGIPAGVRVNSQAYSLHRNEDVFPQAEKWLPQRWLDENGNVDTSSEKSRWFWAFGSGGRMCIGSNLAMADMKCIVSSIWANFTTEVVDDRGMVHAESYTAEPTGTKDGKFCLLRLKPVDG